MKSSVMKWKMDTSENLMTEEGSCEELSACKTRALNGVVIPKLVTLVEHEQGDQCHTDVSHDVDLKSLRSLKFAKLNNVSDLNLMGHSLEQIPAELCALHTLQNLNVSSNNLSTIPESVFSSLLCLKYLNLSKNNLTELPDTICSLKHLKILNVSQNNLSCLPDDIGQLRCLEMLDVSMNNLQTLPPSLEQVHVLYTLNVSFNDLKDLPECVLNIKNLVKLNLSHNGLVSFDRMLRCCGKLVKLDLSYNSLFLFPSWLFEDHCMWLKELNLNHNHMMEASSRSLSFNTCVKYLRKQLLKSLNVSNCKLTVPMLTFLEGLQGLEVLDLGNEPDRGYCPGNAIWVLPSGQLSLSTRLRKLVICNVGLTEFPEDIKGMMALDVLDLGGNELSFLPSSFCKLKNLRSCILSRNQLDSLPDEFGQLASLEELWLHGNKLSRLPESFASLRMLKLLDLYNNNLNEDPECIKFLSSLQAVDLEQNFINTENQGSLYTCSKNYQELKDNLRRLSASSANRIDGAKLKNSSCDSECIGESGDELDKVSSCSENFHDPVPSSVVRQDSSDYSCWDDESEMDDNFDPNERAFVAMPEVAPTMRVNPLMFPRNFCPVDLHFQSIRRSRKLLVTEPVEAQFEDSPFDDTDINPTNISYLLNEKL